MSTPPAQNSTFSFPDRQFRHDGLAKAFLQRHVRLIVGGTNRGLGGLFRAAAKHLGVEWHGRKHQGYSLLRAIYDQTSERAEPVVSIAPRPQKPKKTKIFRPRVSGVDVNSDAFLASYEWRSLRMVVLRKFGARCLCCGATPADGLRMHVDHIKPRRHHPELALVESNLQVLCEVCNHGKGNWDDTNWTEPVQPEVSPEQHEPLWSKKTH